MSIKSSQGEFIKSFNLSPFLPTKASHSHFESKPLLVCVVDTTAGRWSVYGTGEEIGSGLEPKPPNGIIELTKGIIKTSSPSTSIEDL